MGGDTQTEARHGVACQFQLAPPRGGRPGLPSAFHRRKQFQLAPPRGGRQGRTVLHRLLWTGFNSRPRVGGDVEVTLIRLAENSFNSRPRVGGDRRQGTRRPKGSCVSTRAPAWGATVSPGDGDSHGICFNSRPRVGGDWSAIRHRDYPLLFQLAPPRGGRPALTARTAMRTWFQLAPPRGGRRSRSHGQSQIDTVSTRAPAWGATSMPWASLTWNACFNSRPRVGGDEYQVSHRRRAQRFNSRPRVGGDASEST